MIMGLRPPLPLPGMPALPAADRRQSPFDKDTMKPAGFYFAQEELRGFSRAVAGLDERRRSASGLAP